MTIANVEKQKFFLNLVEIGILSVSKEGIVTNNKTGKIYTRKTKKGYVEIAFKRNGKTVHILAHRLAFLVHKGALGALDQVNHKDGVKHNNSIKNFEKTDNQGNCQHAWNTGLREVSKVTKQKLEHKFKGEKSAAALLTNKEADKLREMYKTGNYTQAELGDIFGVSRPTAGSICRNTRYKRRFYIKLNNKK